MNDKKSIIILLFGLLIITLIFFLRIHPIVILDMDDWYYINFYRNAIPEWGNWNPTRVLPETLAPLASMIATKTIMPFNGDFIKSLTIMNALVVTTFMAGYLYCFIKLIREKFKMNLFNTYFLTIIFYLLHFLIFRIHPSNNSYMFYATDAICYYYYVIPSLLNCSLVMYFVADDTFNKKASILKISILILLIYCAILSNTFQSIILVAYIAIKLIKPTIDTIIKKQKFISYIKSNKSKLIILFVWLVSQFFEMNGGRAKDLTSNESFIYRLGKTSMMFLKNITQFNHLFALTLCIIIVIGLYFLFKDKLYKQNMFHEIIPSFAITIIYLLLLCSASIPKYIERVEATFGIYFYIIILMIIAVIYFIKKYPSIVILFPLCTYIIFFQINTPSKTFKESNTINATPQDCIEIDNIIIEQIKEHIDNGENSMYLYIPKFDTDDNWPIATYGMDRIANALYKHGIIKNNIEIEYKYSNELYEHLKIFN